MRDAPMSTFWFTFPHLNLFAIHLGVQCYIYTLSFTIYRPASNNRWICVVFFFSFFSCFFSAILYKKTFNGTERKTTQKMKRYVMADRSTPTEHSLFSSHMCCRALNAKPLTQLSLSRPPVPKRTHFTHTHSITNWFTNENSMCFLFFFYELITCMRLYERMSMNVWMRECVCASEWVRMQATLLPSVWVSIERRRNGLWVK